MNKSVMCLVVLLAVVSWCSAAVIVVNDFEDYAGTAELKAEWTNTANLAIALDTSNVHGGSGSLYYGYNNGNNPWYAKSEHRLDGVVWGTSGQDWTGTTSLSIWYDVTTKKEPFWIKLVDCWGNNIYEKSLGTIDGGWTEVVMDLTAADSKGHTLTASELTRVARIDIIATASSYGAGVVNFDDITRTVIPEPATMVLLSLGGLLLRKRK